VWVAYFGHANAIVRFPLDSGSLTAIVVCHMPSVDHVFHAESGALHCDDAELRTCVTTSQGQVVATPGCTMVDLMREEGFFQVMGTWTFELRGIPHVAISFAHATSLFQATVEVYALLSNVALAKGFCSPVF
jgi:hypothetical protein